MQSLLVKACDLRRQGAALEGENAALVRFTLVGVAGCRGYRSVRHSRTVLTTGAGTDGARHENHLSFRDWAVGDFDTLTGPVKGVNATAEVLLPIAAVAVGMTVLGLVFHIIASGAA